MKTSHKYQASNSNLRETPSQDREKSEIQKLELRISASTSLKDAGFSTVSKKENNKKEL